MRDNLMKLTEEYLGVSIPQEHYEDELAKAEEKLKRISEKNKDGTYDRPEYLAMLIAENITREIFSTYSIMKFEERKRAAQKMDNPTNNLSIA